MSEPWSFINREFCPPNRTCGTEGWLKGSRDVMQLPLPEHWWKTGSSMGHFKDSPSDLKHLIYWKQRVVSRTDTLSMAAVRPQGQGLRPWIHVIEKQHKQDSSWQRVKIYPLPSNPVLPKSSQGTPCAANDLQVFPDGAHPPPYQLVPRGAADLSSCEQSSSSTVRHRNIIIVACYIKWCLNWC